MSSNAAAKPRSKASPSSRTKTSKKTAEPKTPAAVVVKTTTNPHASKPAWADKYKVSLEMNRRYEIPQLGGEVITPERLTLAQADVCFERGCSWITLR